MKITTIRSGHLIIERIPESITGNVAKGIVKMIGENYEGLKVSEGDLVLVVGITNCQWWEINNNSTRHYIIPGGHVIAVGEE